jgi:pyruvate/2-oxoglutarate dehydrogenase complex dihydrolipoamide acyltransferase (E2) component
MKNRTDAEVMAQEEIDVTDILEWMKKENEENGTNYKIFHAVCTAIAKTVYHRPMLNRFISGRCFWQRKEISLSFTAKRQFADGAEESLVFMTAKDDMVIDDFSKKILGDVTKMRQAGKNDLDDLIGKVAKFPRWFLEIFFWIVYRLEYHGIMPKALTDGDSNYASIFLTNLGSIGASASYHHLNNYGTNSFFVIIGTMFKRNDTEGRERTYLPISVILDERIADGFYFVRSLKYFEWLMQHPEELKKPLNELGDYQF